LFSLGSKVLSSASPAAIADDCCVACADGIEFIFLHLLMASCVLKRKITIPWARKSGQRDGVKRSGIDNVSCSLVNAKKDFR
jgi:hypothetical protein